MSRAEPAPVAGRARVGVFGGSGFYSFLDDMVEVDVETPFGPPSAPVSIGSVGPTPVAFLARHGARHQFLPHQVNYRANLWALREVGVERVLAPCAAGSLQPHVHPGEFVVLDQLVNRTWGRQDTYAGGPVPGIGGHVSWADPYCPELRQAVIEAAAAEGITCHPAGTVVVVQGPRFSTRAESAWFRSAGWEVINMTQYPEAYLARELGLCYAAMALITDYDTGLEGVGGIEPVTMDVVFARLAENVERTKGLLARAVPAAAGAGGACGCQAPLPAL
ncbi:MAG: S-methyl-5'-thioadenosine phosphorylase [Acidimicrobiales bacterium]